MLSVFRALFPKWMCLLDYNGICERRYIPTWYLISCLDTTVTRLGLSLSSDGDVCVG